VTAERDPANARFTLIQSMADLLSSAADLWMVASIRSWRGYHRTLRKERLGDGMDAHDGYKKKGEL
jgi:hypothetical protein